MLSPAALVAFEKGRSWPREDTLAKLEDLLDCPRGTLAQIRYNTSSPSPSESVPRGPAVPADSAAALPLRTVHSSLRLLTALCAALPAPSAPGFTDQVTGVLAELRELRMVATELSRFTREPAAVAGLGQLHRLYTATMARAALSPGATLGQQLYTARHTVDLSIEDIAAFTAVPVEAIVAAENDQPVAAAHAAALTQFLSTIVRG